MHTSSNQSHSLACCVVPALVYPLLGTSRDVAVGTTAVGSMLFASTLGPAAPPDDPAAYARLAFTATFFAGALQAALGVLRLGFVVDFLSHAGIVGFMGGCALVVCAQQLKAFLGSPRTPWVSRASCGPYSRSRTRSISIPSLVDLLLCRRCCARV
jgi:MFS superfamily sulfate permease-like transporter